MSSICGFYDLENKNLLRKMANIMRHRGPDRINYHTDKNCSLAQGMLNINDSKKNPYPIQSEDGSIFLICDGEIHSSEELKKQLREKHNFSTDIGTEVIIHLYEELGEDFLKRINGFDGEFAFALYDTKKRKLLLARDKIGLRPLYYALINSKFFFASELKAILQYGEFKKKIDSSALNDYLTYTYIPAPKTIFKDSKKLSPAHYLIYDGNKILVREYWDFDFSKKIKASEEFYSKNIYELLKDSVKRRLKNITTPAILLSGGLDSSAITALSSLISKRQVKTFSVGFEEESYSELEDARIVAEHFNTDHYEYYVTSSDVKKILPKLVWVEDEPFADSSEIPTYYGMKMAKQHTNAVFVGDGGDELFAGYPKRYIYHSLINKYLITPEIIRKCMEKIFSFKIIRKCMEKIFSFIPITKELKGSENLWDEKGKLFFLYL
jgi:asparagine synthase (glutamine-hydrolysing)